MRNTAFIEYTNQLRLCDGDRSGGALIVGYCDPATLNILRGDGWRICHVFVQEIDVVPIYRLVEHVSETELHIEDSLFPNFDALRDEKFNLVLVNSEILLGTRQLRHSLEEILLNIITTAYETTDTDESEFTAFWGHDAA